MRLKATIAAGVVMGSLAAAGTAQAAQITDPSMTFEPSTEDSSVSYTGLDGGDEPTLSLSDSLEDSELEVGYEPVTFNFFDIALPDNGIGGGKVEATLVFTQPEDLAGEGDAAMGYLSLFGSVSGDGLFWYDDPEPLETANGSLFSLEFSDIGEWKHGTDYTVTATLKGESINQVPEPGTLALLGAGLLGIGARSRLKG